MRSLAFLLIIFLPIFNYSQNLKDSIQSLDEYFIKVMKDWHIPSMAIGVVKGDQIVFLKGYGYRDIDNKLPVDENTLFPIDGLGGFTEASIGILQDQGKINIEERLKQFLPELKMYNDYVTNEVTMRDFMTSRTGLASHGFLWYGTNYSREQVFEALPFLQPNTGFRELSPTTIGPYVIKYAVDQISDSSYESFVKSSMFGPLEMNSTCFGLDFENNENKALAYAYDSEGDEFTLFTEEFMKGLHIYNVQNNPGIFSSAKDMCNWMIMRLNDGKFKGKQIVSSDFISQSHSLQVAIGGSDYSKGDINLGRSFESFIDYFHGHHLVSSYGHRGIFDSRLMLFPQDKLGIIVLTGSTFSGRWIVSEVLAEKIILGEYRDWNQVGLNKPRWVDEMEAKPPVERPIGFNKENPPSLELSAYVGKYVHKGYGEITIIEQDNQLRGVRSVTFFDLDHIEKDRFKLHAGESYLNFKLMQFYPDSGGQVDKLTVDFESSLPPIEFIRIKQ